MDTSYPLSIRFSGASCIVTCSLTQEDVAEKAFSTVEMPAATASGWTITRIGPHSENVSSVSWRSAASSSSMICTQVSKYSRAPSASDTVRVVRFSSRVPTWASSSLSERDSTERDTFNRSAALVKLCSFATVANARMD